MMPPPGPLIILTTGAPVLGSVTGSVFLMEQWIISICRENVDGILSHNDAQYEFFNVSERWANSRGVQNDLSWKNEV